MKTIIRSDTLFKLNSKDYQVAKSALKSILKAKTICNEDLMKIFQLSNKSVVSDFFFEFGHFTDDNFIFIENFINRNLNHRNKLFVSDLIEIAIDFNLDLNFKNCIKLLSKDKGNNHYVLLATIEYLFSNLKIIYFKEIAQILNKILLKKDSHNVTKIVSSFYLYRITHQESYLFHLSKNIILNPENNKKLLLNLLKRDFNKKEYFKGYNFLIKLAK